MLSGPERRALDTIAKHLLVDDPHLCRALQMGHSATARRWKLGVCAGGVALGASVMAIGLLLLSFGLVVFGCVLGSLGVLAFVRVRDDRVVDRPRVDRRDPGGDVSPTWWRAA